MAVKAKELMDEIVSAKPVAEVENDEGLYVKPSAEIEIEEDGLCSLVVHPEMGNALDMGNYRVEVGGVIIAVSRDMDGPKDDFAFFGEEIAYEDGVTEADLIKAIKENVEFPPYDVDEYNDTDFDLDDVEASVEVDEDAVFAEDDEGSIYCFDDEEDVPEDFTVVDSEDAVSRLVAAWAEDGGDVDSMMVESYGPWG